MGMGHVDNVGGGKGTRNFKGCQRLATVASTFVSDFSDHIGACRLSFRVKSSLHQKTHVIMSQRLKTKQR
jgi:hypothetical protein